MKGTVSDTAFRSLAGARVEVLDGPQAGMSTTTDASGEFSLTGTFDDTTRFLATKEGYVAATGTLGPFCGQCVPNRWIHLSLEVLAQPVSIAGDYTVTFSAAPECADRLPAELRTRTYTMTIPPPSGSGLPANAYKQVTLSGATFYGGYDTFAVGVAGDYVGFWIEPLVEQVAADAFLVFNLSGSATVAASATSTILFSASGSIDYCAGTSSGEALDACRRGRAAVNAPCTSGNHRLTLTRR